MVENALSQAQALGRNLHELIVTDKFQALFQAENTGRRQPQCFVTARSAGTLGTCMIEGRVSQGVVVGDGSDVGGGASIMGTLSGGGKLRNSIGEHSLLGANAGIGISLGDNCVVEAGLYVTAGTKIEVWDKEKAAAGVALDVVKGADLSGKNNILFIRNSLTGAIQARPRKTGIALNDALHKN